MDNGKTYMDENSEDECQSQDKNEENSKLSEENDSTDSKSENKDMLESRSKSTLWTKSATFVPCVPDCTYKKTLFDLCDLESEPFPLDAFKHFVDSDIIEDIRFQTNLYASQCAFKNWKEVSTDELWVFFALHFLIGITKKPSYGDYFSTNPLISTPIFGESISRDRFFSILRALHFTDNKIEGANSHRLNKLGNLLPSICDRFKHTIQPGEYLCVDESLLLFKGRLAFLQYIPSKRARFGIKFYCLVDCETKFLIGIIPYTGKSTRIEREKIEELGFGGATVVTLTQDYVGENRKIILDNFFTSPHLLYYLLERKTYVLGTVRNNRKNMPKCIRIEKLSKGDVTMYCTDDKMVERWKDCRDVYMLSNFISHKIKPVPNKTSGRSSSCEPKLKKKKPDDAKVPKLKSSSVLRIIVLWEEWMTSTAK